MIRGPIIVAIVGAAVAALAVLAFMNVVERPTTYTEKCGVFFFSSVDGSLIPEETIAPVSCAYAEITAARRSTQSGLERVCFAILDEWKPNYNPEIDSCDWRRGTIGVYPK
jgi:hypothetical protein